MRVDQCEACLTRLEDRMKTQDWYHDLSEPESSDETHRIVDDRPRRAAPKRAVTQARAGVGELGRSLSRLWNGAQDCGLDNEAIQQRIPRFLLEHQRREANSRNAIEHKLAQLRRESQDAMTEHAMSFTRIQQEFHGRSAAEWDSSQCCEIRA